MGTFEPYAEGKYQSAAQVAKSAHDLYVQPVSSAAPVGSMSAATQSGMMRSGSMTVSQTMPAAQSGMMQGNAMAGNTMTGGMMQDGMMQSNTMAGSMCISTRNLLRGRVASITPGAVNTIVAVTLLGGQTVTACITMDAVRDMGLRVGSQVTVVINPNDVLLVC